MDIQGIVDEFVYNEVIHKLTVTAVMNRFHCSPQQVITLIKDTPEILKDFPALWEAGDMLRAMNKEKITHIASNDNDFSRVSGLSVWKPEFVTTGYLIHDH